MFEDVSTQRRKKEKRWEFKDTPEFKTLDVFLREVSTFISPAPSLFLFSSLFEPDFCVQTFLVVPSVSPTAVDGGHQTSTSPEDPRS